MVSTDRFASGLCFQVLTRIPIQDKVGTQFSCIIIGGSYTRLITHFEEQIKKKSNKHHPPQPAVESNPGSPEIQRAGAKKVVAVGLTVHLDKIMEIKTLENKTPTPPPKEPLFYIISLPTLYSERIQQTTKFWKAGVPSTFVKSKNAEIDEQCQIAQENNAQFAVVINEAYYTTGDVQILDVKVKKPITSIHKSQVIAYIQKQLLHQNTSFPVIPHQVSVAPNSPALPARRQQTLVQALLNQTAQVSRTNAFTNL